MSEIVDISPLLGRHFVAKSNNCARFQKLAAGAIRCTWTWEASSDDIAEVEQWAESILGPLEVTRNIGKTTEAENLKIWKRATR